MLRKEEQVTMTTLGFVGLGHMGGNMAVRLLGAGHTVYGETRHRGEVRELEHEGLVWRDTPREIAEAVEVVFTSVRTTASSRTSRRGRTGSSRASLQGRSGST